jgi:multicomponent Na+:H+ antiporter subunit D
MFIEALRDGRAVWPVAIPLAAAALTLLLRRRPMVQRSVMEVAVALTLDSSIVLLASAARGETPVVSFGGWGAPFGITFVADALSAALCSAAGVVTLAVAIFARADVRARRRRAGFDPLFLGMIAAVNGAFLTGDLFNLYVWFELMLVTALGLMTLDRRRAQTDGAIRYAAMSMMGATFMLVGIGLLYGEAGTLDMAHLSAVLAGLLTKAAFYAMLRILVLVFGLTTTPVAGLPPLLALLAAATMLASVLAAIAQTDVRRLLAFHVMGQVAYLVMGLALATSLGVAAAIFYTVHTMLVQTGLFLGAGAIARAGRGYDLRVVGGLIREHPFFSSLFAVLALSISGIPPMSGFWAKALVIDAAFRARTPWSGWLAVVALVTGFLTMYSMSTVWTRAFWQPRRGDGRAPRRIPGAMVTAVGLLAACTVGLGLAIEPAVRLARAAALQLPSERVPPREAQSARLVWRTP